MKNAGAMSTREPRRRGRGRAGAGQRAYEAFLNGSAHSCEQAPRHADLSLALPFDDDGGDDEDHRCGCAAVMPQPVLDADVFTRFRDEGIFNRDTGQAYVDAILSRGDSADPDDLFVEFMGRAPDPEALLERNLGPVPA